MNTNEINKEKIERLETHIEALQKSYDNMILILNQDVEKDDKGDVKLKDTQKRIFAEGTMKVAESADSLLSMIDNQKIKLNSLKSGIYLDQETDDNEKPSEKSKTEIPSKQEEEYPLEKEPRA